MITSTALIEDYLDELLAKAVSSNYEDILKEIKFTSKGFRAIEEKAKQRWNDEGRSKLLSEYIVEEVKKRYKNTSDEELINDFKEHLSTLSQTAKEGIAEDFLDRQKEIEARAKEEYIRPEKEKYDEGLLALFADIISQKASTPDEEVMRQWESFKDKLERKELESKIAERRKQALSDKEEGKKREDKRSKKEAAERKLRAALRREIKPSEADALWSDYLQSGPAQITYDLVQLIGSSTTGKDLMSKRITKFIEEKLPTYEGVNVEEVTKKLTAIKNALDSEEAEAAKKRTEAVAGRTKTSLLAKSEGNKIGQMSNVTRTLRITPIWGKNDRLSPALTKKQSSEFLQPRFVKVDLKDNSWFSAGAGTLKPIVDEILKLVGSSLKEYEKANEEKKTELEIKVNRMGNPPMFLPPTNTLSIIYEKVWEEHAKTQQYDNPPIDFAYWLQGFTDGLAGIKPKEGQSALQDYIKLEQTILPALVKAVKEGVVLDSQTGKVSVVGIQRRYNNAIKKISADNRNEVIMQMFRIMNDESISRKFKGKNKKALEDIEKSIRSQGDEKVQGKTIFYYLLKAHMKFSRTGKGNRNLLTELLRDTQEEDTDEEVRFIEPAEMPKEESDFTPTPRNIPSSTVGGDFYFDKKGKKKFRSRTKIEPAKGPARGEKLRNFIDKETERLKDIKNEDGTRKFSDDEIWQKVGWKKVKEKYIPKDFTGNPIMEQVPVLDEEGKEIPELDEEGQKTGEIITERGDKPAERERTRYVRYPAYEKASDDTKKSLGDLLDYLGESDDIIVKEDTGLILESLNKTQKKKLKTILNVADPTEYFGHDFLKLADVIKVLKSLGVVKGDKQLGKKVIKLEDKNLKVVKLATKLRKDYERLYDELRKLIFPKAGVDEK